MVLEWGATDRGLTDALAGLGIDVATAMPEAEGEFLGVLGELLRAAQKAGTVRRDVDVPDVKAIVVGSQAMQALSAGRGRATPRGRPRRLADVVDPRLPTGR